MTLDPNRLDEHITGNYGEDQIPQCDCDCGCTKRDDNMSGSPLQCDDCDNGVHWDEIKKRYVTYPKKFLVTESWIEHRVAHVEAEDSVEAQQKAIDGDLFDESERNEFVYEVVED